MNRKNQSVFYEEIPDVNDDSSTSNDIVDDLNNDPNANVDKPTGSEADTNTGEDDEGKKPVPYSRFKQVLEESKATKTELAGMADRLADLEKVKTQVAKADDASEEDTGLSKEGKEILKKNGFLTLEEVEAREANLLAKIGGRQAYEKDAADTADWAKKQGYPDFKLEDVEAHAKDKFGGITSPASMKAAYKDLHEEAINEVIVKRAIAQANKPKAVAEKPNASTGKGEPKAPAKGDLQSRTNSVLDRLEAEGKVTVS